MKEMGARRCHGGASLWNAGQVRVTTLIGAALTLSLACWLVFELAESDSQPGAPPEQLTRVSASTRSAAQAERVLPVVSGESTPNLLEGVDVSEATPPEAADPVEDDSVSVQRPPHVVRPSNPHRSYVAKEFFEERYADASLGELMEARIRIEAEVRAMTTEAVSEFFEAGRGEETRRNREEALASPQVNKTNGDGLIMSSQAEVTPTGDLITTTGKLPWIEYTDLYDSQDEVFWLLREINNQSKVPTSGN